MNIVNLIKAPVFTEKTTRLLEKYNQYVFDVAQNLTKTQIRSLVEKSFLVRVVKVNTHYLPPKKNTLNRSITRRNTKRSIISLAKVTFLK
jgi:large subunit ribosomal protein L23